MKVIEDNFSKILETPSVIVLGSFDGIHSGHRTLINSARKLADKIKKDQHIKDIEVMVCTFKNHPLSVVNKEICPKLVMSNEEKSILFEKLKVDIVNFMEFNKEFMSISPDEFIKNLKNYYNVKGIVVGFNYRFGYKNLGDVEILKKYSEILDYQLFVVNPVTVDGEVVSSSAIRHNLQEGNIEKANKFLDRPFMLKGYIIKGKQIGRTIGFPTVNLNYDKSFIVPKGGVYGTIIEYKNNFYKGITNIGYNPTLEGNKLSIETNILNFDKNIYGEEIKLYFIEKIREEKKFVNLEELKNQLSKDKSYINHKDYSMHMDKIPK
ncbi:bifunctional riboflavin kinase/FAD synthetase [Clostridium sp. UBA1056]|uniref:bifunctional riboflavin kinase/FAD synthetase n=1 Tax=unclassified Clostridium TaxID=2614128 RepID=UPI003216E1A9